MTASVHLSQRARQTQDPAISYFMKLALENPSLISLAAGFVDNESLPVDEVRSMAEFVLSGAEIGQPALQYGTTQGHLPLREKILARCLAMDNLTQEQAGWSVEDVVVATGSQQLLYLLGELLFDPGDIVIVEAPSYFVYQGTLASLGVKTLSVPMDDQGLIVDELDALLKKLKQTGELDRVRLVYTVDYFQNPTGLTLSLDRRQKLVEVVKKYSKKQRILILEDSAYRELRFDGPDLPSVKSFDKGNEHVILTMTFSKPWAPGLKTGYGLLPRDLVAPLLRFKGNHDFGSSNLNQHLLDRILENGSLDLHVEKLRGVYREKRDALLEALDAEFKDMEADGLRWTAPDGGFYVYLTTPSYLATGPGSPFMQACIREGVLYVPGEFCYVQDQAGAPTNEARLCYGTASPDQLREAVRRMARAARSVQDSPECKLAGMTR